FAADVTIGRRVERLAAAVVRHVASLREVDVHLGGQDEVDAARQRQVALAGTQALHRQVQRYQRRRARGVHRNARPVRAEEVGQASRYDAARVAGTKIRIDALRVREQHPTVIVVAHAYEDTGLRAVQGARRN